MKRKYNFDATLVDAHNSRGALIGGQWNGLVAQVFNKTTDFGICAVSLTPDRLTAVDFTEFTSLDQVGFFSQSPPIKRHDFIFSDRIAPNIWCFTLAALCVIGLFIWFLGKLLGQHNKTWGSVALRLWGICLKQCMLSMISILRF